MNDKTTEIKRRYNKGQHHKANWLANTGAQLAKEFGVARATMLETLALVRPRTALTQEQFDEATERVAYGKKEYALYLQHSPVAICRDFKIGDRTLRTIVEESMSEDDPVRRFLTMRLVA